MNVKELTRTSISPDRIGHLMRLVDYQKHYPMLFVSVHSLRHFLRSRRELLEERGLLINTTIGLMVDAGRLTEQLPELLASVPEVSA